MDVQVLFNEFLKLFFLWIILGDVVEEELKIDGLLNEKKVVHLQECGH